MKKIQIYIIMVLVSFSVNAGWLDKIAETATKEVTKAVDKNQKEEKAEQKRITDEKKAKEEAENQRIAEEKRQKEEKERQIALEKKQEAEAENQRIVDEKRRKEDNERQTSLEKKQKEEAGNQRNAEEKRQKEEKELVGFLEENFGLAYKNICFGENTDSVINKLKKLDYNPFEGYADYRQQFIIDLEKSIIDKNDKIEISGKTAICNFNPVNIECDTASQKINFYICQNKGQIDDKKMKCAQLGLYATKIEFKETDKDDIKKALEAKYKQTLKPDFEKIEVNDKVFELYGVKNLTIAIPTLTFQNNKIKAVLYSLPKDTRSFVTKEKYPMSELSEKNIKFLKSSMNNYKKNVKEQIQKVKDEQPNISNDDMKKLLEQFGIKMNIDNMDEFRSYMASQQMSTWFAYSLKDILESRGLKLNSNILIVTSTKIEKMIANETIRIALEKQKEAEKKETERKANALSF